jgi:hypothetical protein
VCQAELDAVVEPTGYNVAQLPLFQMIKYILRKKSAIHTDKSDRLAMKSGQGVFKKGKVVGTC